MCLKLFMNQILIVLFSDGLTFRVNVSASGFKACTGKRSKLDHAPKLFASCMMFGEGPLDADCKRRVLGLVISGQSANVELWLNSHYDASSNARPSACNLARSEPSVHGRIRLQFDRGLGISGGHEQCKQSLGAWGRSRSFDGHAGSDFH